MSEPQHPDPVREALPIPDGWRRIGCPECGYIGKFPTDRDEPVFCNHNGEGPVWLTPKMGEPPENWTPMIPVLALADPPLGRVEADVGPARAWDTAWRQESKAEPFVCGECEWYGRVQAMSDAQPSDEQVRIVENGLLGILNFNGIEHDPADIALKARGMVTAVLAARVEQVGEDERTEHTVWEMYEDGGPPVPSEMRFDTRGEAVAYAERIVENRPPSLLWIKVFRSDNEAYQAYHWSRPAKPSLEDGER